jgi:hypothetical protein
MAVEHDDRAWAADRRDFVSDRRDELADRREDAADERDRSADEREQAADERDAELDERERQIDGTVAASGLLSEGAAPGRTELDIAERHRQARRQRDQEALDRDAARRAREAAEQERGARTPTTGLAMAFAAIARHFLEAEDFQGVLDKVVETAVSTISGCEMASISMNERDVGFSTPATTHDAATAADAAQYDADEGPCLDAMGEPLVHAPSLPDPRWPVLGARPVELGVHGVASYQLDGGHPLGDRGASLNSYAHSIDAFDDEALEIGLILAAHASGSIRAIAERDAARELSVQLEAAIASRDVIGQAKGILMERLRLTPDEAFDVLRRSSQRLNVKLRDIAENVAMTGEVEQ